MMFKGIIFDFNGVLLWDTHLHEEAWRIFSTQLRGFPLSISEIFDRIHGKSNRIALEYLLDRPLSAEHVDALSLQKESIYQDLCLQNPQDFKLSPGATGLLDFLTRHRIPYTIATASNQGNLDFFIKHLRLERWFELPKIVYDNGSFPSKLEMYIKAAENLHLAPKHCVVVEDSKAGIIAASQAAIGKVIGLGPIEHHPFLLSVNGVSEVITSLQQIQQKHLFLLGGNVD